MTTPNQRYPSRQPVYWLLAGLFAVAVYGTYWVFVRTDRGQGVEKAAMAGREVRPTEIVGDALDLLDVVSLASLAAACAVLGGIADAAATDACYAAGVGAELTVRLGGSLDPRGSRPLEVEGRVRFLHDTADLGERQAALEVEGVTILVTRRRRPFHHVEDFERLGVRPEAHKIVVVKGGYLVPDLNRIAGRVFLALSPGAVDQAIERLPFERLGRPCYPLDTAFSWQP